MSNAIHLDWIPPGPVAAAFMESDGPIDAIMGPVGSGKTTAALMKIVTRARLQAPSPVDGVRYYKHLVIRDTFVNLKRTIFPSWHALFPKDAGQWIEGPPTSHELKFNDGAGVIALHVDFMGLGEDTIENLLRGYEMTGFYANEADLLSYDGINFLYSRTGRYPSKIHGGASWYGGWLDFNAPEQDHWLYQWLVDKIIPESEPPKEATGVNFFSQPGGLTAAAENRQNLPPDYYEKMESDMPQWRARRLVHNQWGYSRAGRPVYMEYNDQVHVSPVRLEPVRGLPVGIGADAGGSPAAALGQFLPNGQFRVFAEVVTLPGTGPRRFGDMLLDVIRQRCPDHDLFGWADPSAEYGGDKEGADMDWLTTVRLHTGIRFRAAPTNAPLMRQEALRQPLSRMIEGVPGFLLCPSCKTIRKALNSGYHYRRIQLAGATGRYDTKPSKNMFSHITEAAEYLALGGPGGLAAVIGKRPANQRRVKVESDYDVFTGEMA